MLKDVGSPTQAIDMCTETAPVTHSEPIETTATSSANVLPTSISSTTSSTSSLPYASQGGKTKEKGTKKKDRLPKLTLTDIQDMVAECNFETHKNERITFRFGLKEDAPEDIAEKMVILNCD